MGNASMKCMFDTNVFNRILDGVISLESFAEVIVPYATHIQRDELQNTQDESRRKALLKVFHQVVNASTETTSFALDTSRLDEAKLSGRIDEVQLTEGGMTQTLSAVWGASKWGESMWSGDQSLYPVLRAELDHKKAKPNNVQDALIADTAIRGGYVLVTDDTDLAEITKKYGGRYIFVRELVRQHDRGNEPHTTGI
jgi:predicted nucleic acid-binding protein